MRQIGRNAVARRVGVAVLSGLLVVGVTGCQKSADTPSAGSSTPSESASATPSESASATPSDQPSSTQVLTNMGDDFRGILADVTTDACPVEKGKVTAKGSVVNSDAKAADISIGVIWLKPDSGDSVAIGEWTGKNVAPGESVDWSVTATLPSKPGRCVLQAKANKAGTLK